MNPSAINININLNNCLNNKPFTKYPTSFREVKIGRTLYRVTSVFKGEKELGSTLEKLAIRHVLDELNARTSELLRA